jgi:hypothetical protein
MKNVLVALSLICFVAVSSVSAQSPATATASKEKTAVAASPAAASATPSDAKQAPAAANETPAATCHGSAKKSCCKNGDAKACTPAQRAACGDHAKAETPAPKVEGSASTK